MASNPETDAAAKRFNTAVGSGSGRAVRPAFWTARLRAA